MLYPLSMLFFPYNNCIQKVNCQKLKYIFKNNRVILYIFNNIIIL